MRKRKKERKRTKGRKRDRLIPSIRLPIVRKLSDLLGLSSSLAAARLNLKNHVEIVKKFRGPPVLHPRNILRGTTSAVMSGLLYIKFSESNSARRLLVSFTDYLPSLFSFLILLRHAAHAPFSFFLFLLQTDAKNLATLTYPTWADLTA